MQMPDAGQAVVEREKIVDYLLNRAHPDNGGKADFFMGMGFFADDWEVLADAFREMALHTPVLQSVKSPHGQKFVLEGPFTTPCGKRPLVRSVWIIDVGVVAP